MSPEAAIKKMRSAGLSEQACTAFERNFRVWAAGQSAVVRERDITPVAELPLFNECTKPSPAAIEFLRHAAVLKLNGGLGTSMGLEKAKSLLEVRTGLTFLDLIARQILSLRQQCGHLLPLFFLNSFNTSADTCEWLQKHPELGDPEEIEIVQNRIPKITGKGEPIEWPQDPSMEWCPPGHGDLYTVLGAGGLITRLRSKGVEFLFVSNSDNLGAWLNPALLEWFAKSGAPFAMEVTLRTEADRKGGHLARGPHGLLLRESAQCAAEDLDAFQDITRHRYFNTNNLWLRLDRIEQALEEHGGFLPLPVIANAKTVNPRDPKSPRVIQLETAMGAAIGLFPDAAAIEVSRLRFSPVKTTADLLALRSDAYEITPEGRVQLAPGRNGIPPKISLDANYKLVDALNDATARAVPSLIRCTSLEIKGRICFVPGTEFVGDVKIENPGSEPVDCPAGRHENCRLVL